MTASWEITVSLTAEQPISKHCCVNSNVLFALLQSILWMGFYFFLLGAGSDSLQIAKKIAVFSLYFFDLQNQVFFFTT